MNRIRSLDVLRGITVFAMILCAAISYGAGLPAWMFHCQVPPPDYVFHPEVRGITWVDMIFPFFIFAMGAAMPFSLGKKVDKGESLPCICAGIIRRWAILVGFGLAIGHAGRVGGIDIAPEGQMAIRFLIWLLMFSALVRTRHRWINLCGWLSLAACFAVLHFCCGLPLSLHHNDIIIILLSTVALLGGFIWLFTKESLRLRTAVWMVLIAAKLIGWSWGQYLVIALPATMVGDLLRRPVTSSPKHFGICSALALGAVLLQLWGLFTRNVLADGLITALLGAAFLILTYKEKCQAAQIGRMGFVLLLAGIAFDPLDGGIAKDHCNMSYLLVTGGQAALALFCLMWTESRRPLSRNFSLLGQNPMIAYNIAWFVICPLLTVTGLMGLIDGCCAGAPLIGLLRGVFITLIMMACTCTFSHLKIFLKS